MKKIILASAIALSLTGCASIFKGSTQPVTIMSVPDGATVTIANRAGMVIHSGVTPATVTLKRGAGYFKSEQYAIVIKKEGYATRQMTITGNVNGWYFGNIVFGGLIGMLAVDPATGAMYSFPESVSTTLEQQTKQTADAGNSLTIMSTDAVPKDLMRQARLIGKVE